MTELLMALALINQNPTVTIPIDPTKLQASVVIDTSFKDAQGVTWTLKGTLIARPAVPAPAPTPTPVPPSATTPLINAYRDLDGNWLVQAKPGQRFLVVGENFGDGGSVEYAAGQVPTIAWGENLIVAQLPVPLFPAPPSTITVKRNDGLNYSGLAFKVVR
jgi:hypothetical protein